MSWLWKNQIFGEIQAINPEADGGLLLPLRTDALIP